MNEEQGKLIFGLVLKKIRLVRGLSLREVSKLVGFCPTYIHDLETGKRLPTLEVISSISNSLVLSEAEEKALNKGYLYAHPSIAIPTDIMYYILENNLIDTIKQLEQLDKKGIKLKKLVASLNQNSHNKSINN